MHQYIAKRNFETGLRALIHKGDILELFETEDGMCYFEVAESVFALGFEVGLTAKEVENFLNKVVAS